MQAYYVSDQERYDGDLELDEAEEVLSDRDAELTDLERNWLVNWLASNDRTAAT